MIRPSVISEKGPILALNPTLELVQLVPVVVVQARLQEQAQPQSLFAAPVVDPRWLQL